MITACFILHNLAKQWHELEFDNAIELDIDMNNDNQNYNFNNDRVLRQLGQDKRMEIVCYLYANR